jgi:hypothetical protein
VSVHWRHLPHDGYLSGEETQREVVSSFQRAGWAAPVHHHDEHFVLDVMVRAGAAEVVDD